MDLLFCTIWKYVSMYVEHNGKHNGNLNAVVHIMCIYISTTADPPHLKHAQREEHYVFMFHTVIHNI